MHSKPTVELPTISIVTPSYNQAQYIEQTICSILNQNYPKLEYVIIDGGSTDGSQKIIKKYAKQLAYWHSKPDGGQSNAINTGFSKTSGEIMMWLNSDDILMPGSLHLIGSIFAHFPNVDWVSALPTTITPDSRINFVSQPPWYNQFLLQKGLYTRKYCGFVMQEGTWWRRSLWNKAGGCVMDVPYSMDWQLWRSFAKETDLVLVKAVLAGYRLNPDRKNNDQHARYYLEIGHTIPNILTIPLKYLWRKIANGAHALRLAPLIYYDETLLSWVFRDQTRTIRPFKILR